jgi:hypothetical protein
MPKNRSTKTMSFDAIGRDLTPSEVRDAKAFAEKYSPGGTLPARAEVHARQRQVVDQVLQAELARQAAEQGGSGDRPGEHPIPLLPLLDFQDAQPALPWVAPRPPVALAIREEERFLVLFQVADTPLRQGPWRAEELAKQGESACDADAEAFAQSLVNVVRDRLSIHQLDYVVKAFSAELAEQEALRQQSVSINQAQAKVSSGSSS